jgi:SAM-dependent MidA family methyltransferase
MVAKILPEPPFAPPPANVPSPGEEALAASARLCARIRAELERDGFMPFSRFMELALYAPGMGYYAAGATKFGRSGDFVTAPELSPLFAEALASQLVQVFAQAPARILELGAGSARLAADLIAALNRRGIRLERYSILETSADLRARQQQLLESLAPIKVARIDWLERLPERYVGVVLGNEVLDALPVRLIRKVGAEARELGLAWDSADDRPVWRARELDPELTEIVGELELPDDYTTEVHLAARGLVRSLAERLDRGVVLFIDYGFPRREYYHAERR